jgi:hypothetical protein
MGEQAVVAHAYPDVNGQNMEHGQYSQALPTEKEKRSKGTGMKESDDRKSEPIDTFAHGDGAAHADHLSRGNSVGRR